MEQVYYGQGIWGRGRKDRTRPGTPLPSSPAWVGATYRVLGVYLCSRGVVVDLASTVERERFRAFVRKWEALEQRRDTASEEERQACRRENPLGGDFQAVLTVNGKELKQKSASGTAWVPESCAWEGYQNKDAVCRLMEGYGLDETEVWAFRRCHFPWATKRRPREIRSMSLCLSPRPVDFTVGHIENTAPGQEMTVVHPITGNHYQVRIAAVESDTVPEHPGQEGVIYPRHCVALSYTVEPELPGLRIWDCSPGDRPETPDGPIAASVGVIMRVPKSGEPCVAASSLYHRPPEKVRWRLVVSAAVETDTNLILV